MVEAKIINIAIVITDSIIHHLKDEKAIILLGSHQIGKSTLFTHAQQEIDYIEERNGEMKAYEFCYKIRKACHLKR